MDDTQQKPLAIISGGVGHLGSAITAKLIHSGWNVAVLARNPKSTSVAAVYECDVTDEKQVASSIAKITDDHGPIRACIHAASAAMPTGRSLLSDTSTDVFNAQISVALNGVFFLAKYCVPHMVSGSTFIGITTKLIEPKAMPPSIMGSYVTAKYGLRGFLRTLTSELKPKEIRVYAVAPGSLPGGLNRNLPPAILDLFAKKTGAGLTSADDVADLVYELCAVQDAYPTGSSITTPPIESDSL